VIGYGMDKIINAFNRLFKTNKIVTLAIIALLGLVVVFLGKDLISAFLQTSKEVSL
jgi:Na+/alanine symporter